MATRGPPRATDAEIDDRPALDKVRDKLASGLMSTLDALRSGSR